MGTRRQCQGAKEQANINISINKIKEFNLKSSWIDIKKAFDSVSHKCLIKILTDLKVPKYLLEFITNSMNRWSLRLHKGKEELTKVKLECGIPQGDSLSPLLFVIMLEPLSRYLINFHEKVSTETESKIFRTNHLLFIDDLKLISESSEVLEKLIKCTEYYFRALDLEINDKKSAINTTLPETKYTMLEWKKEYQYLGVLKNKRSMTIESTKSLIKNKIIDRIRLLCGTKLNAINIMTAINQLAISSLNYYIGLLEYEPQEFSNLDLEIRNILREYKVHFKLANKERLYLPRTKMGRELSSIVFKSQSMLLRFYDSINI